MLLGVCCPPFLRADCCLLAIVCFVLFGVWLLLLVALCVGACCVFAVACRMPFVCCCLSFVVCCLLFIDGLLLCVLFVFRIR